MGHTGPWAIAPSGTALVWSYAANPLHLRDFETDIEKRSPKPIGQAMRIDPPIMSKHGRVGWAWSPDSKRLLVITPSQMRLLTPNGAVAGQVLRPSGLAMESFHLMADDRALLITSNETEAALHIVALTGDAPGSVTDVRLPVSEGSYAIVYAPKAKERLSIVKRQGWDRLVFTALLAPQTQPRSSAGSSGS